MQVVCNNCHPERQVPQAFAHAELEVERQVFVQRNVLKPTTNITQEKEDQSLVTRLDAQKQSIHEWKLRLARLKAEHDILYKKQHNITLYADIDYTTQNEFLRGKIRELEKAIVDARNGVIRKSLFNEGKDNQPQPQQQQQQQKA